MTHYVGPSAWLKPEIGKMGWDEMGWVTLHIVILIEQWTIGDSFYTFYITK